ncbi:putative F-box/LRR-repeat protein 23 [Vicia villosa]|uniref:putative F-box/LRR-repeat protein 23 n=1 Tax=Vicia villosa TaxID=3911 RepID=UPI00273C0014|nr:putative F-box/LRR-repeat protein 23 [Vicia villosa]XP_058765347.1 putative F-box/LRR-repeat protein 23 [Vicia villosa]
MESLQPASSSSVTCSSNSNAVIDSGERNWLDLPRDTVLSIFVKLDTIDLLVRAHNVCTTWRNISKDPFLYRIINMPNLGDPETNSELEVLCHRAIDYSCGNAIDINIEYFGTDDLLCHIANSATHLRCLRLACCYSVTDGGFCVVAEKLSHLEELDISISGGFSPDSLEVIGRFFPQLKTFKFNIQAYRYPHIEYDDDAFAIAQFMSGLCHLQLIGNKMTNDGLLAILGGCPRLESLDIRQCFNINLEGSLGKRCKEQIKNLRLPNDATDDYPFETEDYPEGDYPDGISDIDLDLLSGDDYELSDGSEFSEFEFDANYYDF